MARRPKHLRRLNHLKYQQGQQSFASRCGASWDHELALVDFRHEQHRPNREPTAAFGYRRIPS